MPTHKHSRDVRDNYSQSGLDAAAYPELNKETCENYEEAARAIGAGLSASGAICPMCRHKDLCEYRVGLEAAESAAHRIATHRRALLSMTGLAEGRHYIAIHENPVDVIRPTQEISSGLERVAEVSQAAKDSARGRSNMDEYQFFWRMETEAHKLIELYQQTDDTTPLDIPTSIGTPRNVDARLYAAMQELDVYPAGDALRIVKGIAAGEVDQLMLRVDRIHAKGRQTAIKKSIIAVWRTGLPENVPVWLSDATADRSEIESIAGRPVHDMTPEGRLQQQHAALQIPIDIKQSTAAGTVVKVLQALLVAFPEPQRIGVICHREHVSTIEGTAHKGPVLDETCRSRISKIAYFRGGESCGSNKWLDECDLIVVFGTPRVPPTVIKSRLIQTGRSAAAARDGEWGLDYWSGITTRGKRQTIRTLAYRDHDWHSAHQAIVGSELLQAVGRGRGICPNGLPVLVLSNEPLGLPLAEIDIEPLGETAVRVLKEVARLSAINPKGESNGELSATIPKYIYLESVAVSTSSLVASLGLPERTVRWHLSELRRRNLVEQVGQRRGWKLTAGGQQFLSPTSQPQAAAAAAGGDGQQDKP